MDNKGNGYIVVSEHHLPDITQARWERNRDKFIKTVREISEKRADEEAKTDKSVNYIIEGTPVVGQDDVGSIPVEPAFLLVYAAAGNEPLEELKGFE